MKTLVLLRHGQSLWNLENRFTGWTNVDLTPRGEQEARAAGRALKAAGIVFERAYTSCLKRAVKTLDITLAEMGQTNVPIAQSWRLNEKHYGALQGLNKTETAQKYGAEQVQRWRRSYDTPPAPLDWDDPRHPRFDPLYKNIPPQDLPATESLKTCIERTLPYWQQEIRPALQAAAGAVLVVAHGNSLRGLIKVLKNISDADIVAVELPTGAPYIFEFDDNLHLTKDLLLK